MKRIFFTTYPKRKIIVDSTHTLSIFKRDIPSEVIAKRSYELLLIIKESGINQEHYSKLPNVPRSKATNLVIEYAKSVLLYMSDLDVIIALGVQEKMNYLQEIIADTAYGTKDNIETCESKNIKVVAPLQPSVNGFRDKNDGFTYNKDA